MFDLLDAAKTVLNSVSSTNLFPWSFIESNHGPFQLSSQIRPLERKRKNNQLEPKETKKLKPTPIMKEVFPSKLPLAEAVLPKSPSLSSFNRSLTPPASPLQSPEKLHQSKIETEEVASSSPLKPTCQHMGPKSPSPSAASSNICSHSPSVTPVQSPLKLAAKLPEKPNQPTSIIEEVVLSSSPLKPTPQHMQLKSLSTSPSSCTCLHSPPSQPVQTPEKPHQPTITIEEIVLSSPSSCADSHSPTTSQSASPLQSPEKTNQPLTAVKKDLVSSSLSDSISQTAKNLSPSKLSILALQNLNFFSGNLELINKLINGNFDYNQFKNELKNTFDIIMFYLFVEAKISLNSASSINLFPWNFDEFHIGMFPHEPYQVFSSLHGNSPLPDKKIREDFQRKVSAVDTKSRKRFICINDLCNHGKERFSKRENIVLHLYKKYVLFVCVACGAMFHEKGTLGVHQVSHCRFRKSSKPRDDIKNGIKNKVDKEVEEDNHDVSEKNVIIKTEEEVVKILIQTALNRAHEDGLLTQFENTETLLSTLSKDFKAMSFLVLLSSVIMCQEGKYGLERDELQCHDDYFKIWMDTERCFQIVELATKKATSIEALESRVKRSVVKEGDAYVCKYPFCRCSGRFTRKIESELISHIEQCNYRLVCCGCHSSFKVITSLIRHSNDNCKCRKLLDKMEEANKKY